MSAKVTGDWIDISIPIRKDMVRWPGDPAVNISAAKSIRKGNSCNLSRISLGSHTGTHIDSPAHVFKKGKTISQLPLEAVIGPARVIAINDRTYIKPTELRTKKIRRGERILFKTYNSQRCWKLKRFIKDFVFLSQEAAEYLVQKGVRTVGVDYLSVGSYYYGGSEVHRLLLGAGIWVVEGLNLSAVRAGTYDLICLPLRILNSDGAPARAILKSH